MRSRESRRSLAEKPKGNSDRMPSEREIVEFIEYLMSRKNCRFYGIKTIVIIAKERRLCTQLTGV